MGFHIRINKTSDKLLTTLKTSPEEIFKDRYHCYLLFLVGASDDEAMDWLIKNVVSLDSLTGAEIAFGIFMKNLKIPLFTDSDLNNRPPKIVASIPAKELTEGNSYEDIIKRYIHEHVYDHDEVIAITYATDIVAKEFKVIDRLPCMLLLDPIPFGTIHVVQLTNVICKHLIKIIRQSIHKYFVETQGKPIAFSYTNAILDAQYNLEQFEHKKEIHIKQIEKINNELARLKGEKSSETGVDQIKKTLDSVKHHIDNGAARKTRIALFGGSFKNRHTSTSGLEIDDSTKEMILSFLENECAIIRENNDTMDALTGYLEMNDSTSLWRDRVGLIYSKHVAPLLGLPNGSEIDIDKIKIRSWIEQLKIRKEVLVSRIYKLLPDIETIENKIKEEYQRKNKQQIDVVQLELYNAQLEFENYKKNYIATKKKLEDLLDESIRLYQKNNPITFSSIFVKEVKSLKMDAFLSQTKIAGGKLTENIFKPDTILKILDLINKMTH
jgi:hypothetical protein